MPARSVLDSGFAGTAGARHAGGSAAALIDEEIDVIEKPLQLSRLIAQQAPLLKRIGIGAGQPRDVVTGDGGLDRVQPFSRDVEGHCDLLPDLVDRGSCSAALWLSGNRLELNTKDH